VVSGPASTAPVLRLPATGMPVAPAEMTSQPPDGSKNAGTACSRAFSSSSVLDFAGELMNEISTSGVVALDAGQQAAEVACRSV
jgi:hypothetical protein